MWGSRNEEISTVIFITISAWCQSLWIFQCNGSGNDCKYCNVIESQKTVFERYQDYFAILRKACFLYYFRAALKRLAFNSSAIMYYVWRRRILNLKSIPPYNLNIPWSHTLVYQIMTSQTYNNNDVLLFSLQIWIKFYRIKCFDQFRVNKRDTDCFEQLHEENTKP